MRNKFSIDFKRLLELKIITLLEARLRVTLSAPSQSTCLPCSWTVRRATLYFQFSTQNTNFFLLQFQLQFSQAAPVLLTFIIHQNLKLVSPHSLLRAFIIQCVQDVRSKVLTCDVLVVDCCRLVSLRLVHWWGLKRIGIQK